MRLDDRVRVEGFVVALLNRHRRQQLRERGVGDLVDHRQLQRFDEVRLELVIAAQMLTGRRGVDQHQAAHLRRMVLGEGQRERAAVGMADEDRPRDVQRSSSASSVAIWRSNLT